MPEIFWMTTFHWCELTFGSRMLKNVCERFHPERSEECHPGNKGNTRFLAALGMTGQTVFFSIPRGPYE
jgi:hypothetical protein